MSALSEAQASCHICGSETGSSSYGGTQFRECSRCGYAALRDPRGREDYWADHTLTDPGDPYWVKVRQRYFDSALTLLDGHGSGKRLLDIGGGVGFFAERAVSQGWDAYSLDISPTVSAIAAERLGPERAKSSLATVDKHSYDVATLWCVVAHTIAPETILEAAHEALRPGGVVWLTTPNFSFQKRYATVRSALRRPIDFTADDHIGHFTPRAIESLLLRGGFTRVRFNLAGISETCIMAKSESRALVGAKRAWNQLAYGASTHGLPNFMSELQVTAERA